MNEGTRVVVVAFEPTPGIDRDTLESQRKHMEMYRGKTGVIREIDTDHSHPYIVDFPTIKAGRVRLSGAEIEAAE